VREGIKVGMKTNAEITEKILKSKKILKKDVIKSMRALVQAMQLLKELTRETR